MAATALLSLTAAVAGCGTESYNNDSKPPAVLTVGVAINEDEIAVAPAKFDAGPTRLIITNQTGAKQLVTVSTDRNERTVPVDVSQTASFKLTIEPGFLSIDADNAAADPFEVNVGPPRASAQQDLDQP
ncbi:MAG: hypothetical protein WAP37_08505 [Solirubrobacterales bacterium]